MVNRLYRTLQDQKCLQVINSNTILQLFFFYHMYQQPKPTSTSSNVHQQTQKDLPYMRIVTSLDDPSILKLKRGKNTPAIHIYTLKKYMKEFQHHYKIKVQKGQKSQEVNYFQDAWKKLVQITGDGPKRNNILFGGCLPDKNDPEAVKQFIINRMNARVLELIYQKYMVDIMFGSSKMEDKLTNSMFIYEYRTRLPNPLLCGGLQCIRPMTPQKKYKKKAQQKQKTQKEEIKVPKTKTIKK